MDKTSYLGIHARYLDIDTIQYDYGFCENKAFFRKIKEIILSHIQIVDREIFTK